MKIFNVFLVLILILISSNSHANLCEKYNKEIYALLAIKLKDISNEKHLKLDPFDRFNKIFNDDLCKSPKVMKEIRKVFEEKKKICNKSDLTEKDAENISKNIGNNDSETNLLDFIIKDFKKTCSSLSNGKFIDCGIEEKIKEAFNLDLPVNVSPVDACYLTQSFLRDTLGVGCNCEKKDRISTPTINESNSCEIPGPDGRCPGAPPAQVSPVNQTQQGLYSKQETQKFRERRKKSLTASGR